MRAHVLAVFLALAAAPAASALAQAAKAPLAGSAEQPHLLISDPEVRSSYVIGLNIGNRLRNDGIPLSVEALDAGIAEALASAKPRLTDEEIRTVLTQVQAEYQTRAQEKLAHLAETNRTEGAAFLKANAAAADVKTLPSGLQYKVLTPGTGARPGPTDTIVCNYRGSLIDGTEFDSSYRRGEPTTIPVNGVIKGWAEALQMMPVGSKWRLYIPSDLAYGPDGKGAIGPNATLIFDVELLSIQGKDQPPPLPLPLPPPLAHTPPKR